MTEQSHEPAPVLEILRRFQDTGSKPIKAARSHVNGLRLWVVAIRAQLEKIYGKDSPHLAAFPPISVPSRSAGIPGISRPTNSPSDIDVSGVFAQRMAQLNRIIEDLEALVPNSVSQNRGKRIFIGHGRSPLWRELKDFIAEDLELPWDEFNRESVAGISTSERLQTMLSQAAFAFLIMTAEDEHSDAKLHARPNVIHEAGLFQGHLGLRRAIVMLEEGCSEFSNIHGLGEIRFPRGDIGARFEQVRKVLEREKLI